MKHLIIALTSVWFTTTFSGCKLLDKLRTFNMDYSVEFSISGSPLGLPIDLPTPAITTNSEQRFEDEGIESDWIDSVRLIGLKLTVTSPQGEDFSFLENVSIYMNADNQPEVLIASKIPVPENAGNSIDLEVTGADLYPYISQNSFSLRTEATTDEAFTQTIDFRADMVIEVKATIPGGK